MLQDERRLRDLAREIGWPERIASLEAGIERLDLFPIVDKRLIRTEMRSVPEESPQSGLAPGFAMSFAQKPPHNCAAERS